MKSKRLLLMLLMALLVPWAAMAQQAIPYSYGFEDNDLSVDGWSAQITSTSSGIATAAAHDGTYGFRFNYSEQDAYLVSPVLTGTESGVALSFYYKEYSSSYGDEQFYVGYTTDETVTDPSTFTYGNITTASLSWQLYEATLPAGTKKVAIKYVYNDAFYLYLDDFSFEAPSSCPKPTDLAFTLTPGDGTVATLSWTSDADAWQICLNGDETNLIPATTNPYTLTGLTPETTYTAKVRANCGSEQSDWSNEVTFKPTNAYQLTVNDGTTTNGYVPIYGYYVDAITKSQFIIPAENLADMAWGTINKMTFYAAADKNWGAAQFEVYMTETSETTLSALADYGTMTKVMNAASLSISGNQMVVEFDTPYSYMGGNLMIGFLQTVTGTYSSCSWYGVSATGASMGGYGTSITQQNFLPKTTFEYTPGEQPACMWPTNLSVSNVTARTADLNWTENGEAKAWEVEVVSEYTTTRNADAIPFTLEGLEPETEYTVRVRSVCDTEVYSDWSTPITFTTGIACTAPTDLVISDITAYSANVAWTGDNENFEVRYAIDNSPVTDFEDSSLQGWTNIDADGDGYVWVLGSQCAGIYLVEGSSLAGNGHDGSEADFVTSGSYSNVTGTGALYPDNYLVSPQVTLGGTISFWAQAQDASYPAEHFGVAVSTTGNTDAADFTTIAEWTFGSRSATVFRSSKAPRGGNRAQTEWVLYTVDLSAYSGQGYVAIRHFDCTDQFLLNVDDITITSPSGYEWVNVTNPTNPQALTDLEPETKYIVQVRFNCGDDGYSAWLEGSFTTLPTCMVPTNLVISNIDKRSADLAWTANGEETQWQICLNGDETNLILVSDTSYSFTNLTPETLYNVKVRAYCDEELQSAWSTPAIFTTLVACPAPTALAISDITNVSAVATWTYDGDVEFEYAEDVWKHYDNGTFGTSMGAGGTIYWGILLTPDMLPANQPLTHIAMYENENNANPTTISIYSGGDTAPGTFLYSEEVTPVGSGFHEIALAEPVEFDATQNLWIVCYNDADTYPAAGSANLTNPNGRWVSLDGEEWADINGYGYNYTWMIRAAFGNNAQTNWVSVNNPATPQTIAGLTPETNYFVRLRAVCGGEDGESVWVTTSFTTDVACPAPTALAATPYALSAELSWEGVSESYTVRYGYDEVGETIYSEDFAEGIPTDWTNDATYPWTVVDGYIQSSNAGVSSSTSTISLTMTVLSDANFEFDAECMGEGTGTAWDKCIFSIDNVAQFTYGAHVSGWNHYSFFITAGEHTFTWSYSKDSSVNPTGDYFAIDNIAINAVNRIWNTTTADTNECTITGLTPMTTYYVQVQGNCGDYGLSEWSEIISFTTLEQTIVTQTIELTEGWNWVSLSIEAGDPVELLQMLEAALGDNAVQIQSFDDNTEFDGEEWFGGLDDIGISNAQMYMIEVVNDCTIELQGTPANPADYEIYIEPEQWTWIGYPCTVEQNIADALADFEPEEGDQIQAGNIMTEFDGEEWFGDFETLVPGQGYMYYSNSDETKVLVIRASAKARRVIANAGPIQAKKMRTTDVDVNL